MGLIETIKLIDADMLKRMIEAKVNYLASPLQKYLFESTTYRSPVAPHERLHSLHSQTYRYPSLIRSDQNFLLPI